MNRDFHEHTEFPRQESQQYMYDETPYFQPSQHELERQKLRVPSARIREQAPEFVGLLRRGIVVAAIVAFGIFSLLMANLVGAQNVQGFPGGSHFPINPPSHFQKHSIFYHPHKHHW
jgi:hypothetical protein